ncbi:MAG: putative membrane protein YfcA [Bradymonadia bacterium]
MTLAVAFLLIGFLAGAINAAAGGGSLLTIALLVESGLSAPVANATNRVAVLIQTFGSGSRFLNDGVLPKTEVFQLTPVSLVGAGIGATIAARVPDEPFRIALAVLFGIIGTVLFAQALRPSAKAASASRSLKPWQLQVCVFAIGVYAGFIQAGVGLLMLLVLHLAHGMDLARANAVKIALVGAWTVLAIAIFWHHGLIRWAPGIWLGVGGIFGGWMGAGVVQRVNPRGMRFAIAVAVWIAAIRFAL